MDQVTDPNENAISTEDHHPSQNSEEEYISSEEVIASATASGN